MNLETLANIGEFLGGLAILVSLVYLIVSLRQNTVQLSENLKSLQRSEQRATYEQHDRYRAATLDPDIANLWLKGLAGELNEQGDRLRFDSLMLMMTYSSENNFELTDQGLDSDGQGWERIAVRIASVYDTPGGRRWWERTQSQFKPGFVESIEAHRQTAQAG